LLLLRGSLIRNIDGALDGAILFISLFAFISIFEFDYCSGKPNNK
jgi:hypothetical protein